MQARQVLLLTMNNLSDANLMPEARESAEDFEEQGLIRRCQAGDVKAFEQVVRRYQTQVYNIAYGMLGNVDDAQDLTQDVFAIVWQKIGQFQFKARFSTWLYRITTNLSLNEKNRQGRRQTIPVEIDDTQAWTPIDTNTPEKMALLAEQRQLLQSALAKLKSKHRQILVLREMEDLSYEELSEVLGCSVGRVKSRLFEARMALRRILQQKDGY